MDVTLIYFQGTLGIVTEGKTATRWCARTLKLHPPATLRLAPVIPTKVAMAQFPDVERAVNAVQEILNSPYGAHVRTCLNRNIEIGLDSTLQNALNFSMITVR